MVDMKLVCRAWLGIVLVCVLVFVHDTQPSSASKGLIGAFGSKGGGSGQFRGTQGIAVDQATGDVYVVDRNNGRVEIFDGNGGFLGSFGSEGEGAGQMSGPEGIAIDQATGTVYVTDLENRRVDVFSPTGVFEGAWGQDVDATTLGTGFEFCPATDVCQAGAAATTEIAGAFGTSIGYPAVNPNNGNVIVADAANRRIDEFSVTFTLGVVTGASFERGIGWGVVSNADAELQTCTVGTGCVAGLEGAESGEFGASGPTRVAVDSSNAIYAIDLSNLRLQKFNAAGTSANVFAESQLSGSPAPADVAIDPSTSHVLVTKVIEGEQRVLEFDVTGTALLDTHGMGAGLGEDSGLGASAFNGDLYLSSGNSVFLLNTVAPESVGVADVSDSSATLQASINPGGADAKYVFEYGTSNSYGTSIPVPEKDVGSGTSLVRVSEHLQGLNADTTYHFRIVVKTSTGSQDGPDHIFTTASMDQGVTLPDGRKWEMISPAAKNGAVIQPMNKGGVLQASVDGEAIAYFADGTVSPDPAGNYVVSDIVSRHNPGTGWSSQNVSPPHETAAGIRPGKGLEYRFFSNDLSLGAVQQFGETPLSSETTEKTPYIRDVAGGVYKPLLTAANVPVATKFGGQVEFLSATPDLSHVILSSGVALTKTPSGGGLYEWTAGKLQLVSVLPGIGEISAAGYPFIFLGGGEDENTRNVVSADGNHVVWTAEGVLYLRDMLTKETIQLDAVQPGGSGIGPSAPQFQIASNDGSKIFFTDSQQLVAGSKAELEKPDLYEFDVNSGTLTDLVAEQNPHESANVQSLVLGASEDGSYIYLVARGSLTTTENSHKEKAWPGGNNLYMLHDNGGQWETTFVTSLATDDGRDWNDPVRGNPQNLETLTARVSPNGRYVTFMSDRSLTGYDGRDASAGVPDEEVYLYAAGANSLICASCNPTGARPQGVFDSSENAETGTMALLPDHVGIWQGRWLAGDIPGWTPYDFTHARYQSRYLSDTGRLFFNSADSLVSQDVNHKMDVYEYEPEGVGSCKSASVGFSVVSGGCVGLVSSGTSGEESAFLDASESGDDVFFLTTSPLVSTDVDTSLDVYDAHVCSAVVPCTVASTTSSLCAAVDSCRSSQSSQPTSVFGPPPSVSLLGSGNLVHSTQASKKQKPKAKKKKKKRTRLKRKRVKARKTGSHSTHRRVR